MFNKMKINKAQPKIEQQVEEVTEQEVRTMASETANQLSQNQDTLGESSTVSTESEPTHFDDLIVASSDDGGDGGDDNPPSNQGMIDAQAFHALFCVSFNTVSTVTKLKSLAVDAADDACINCTRAVYETIADIPMLHFMLMPNGKWMERAVAIGMFTVPMAIGVSNELAARTVKANTDKANGQPSAKQEFKSMKDLANEQGIS